MSDRFFLDTNIFVYEVDADALKSKRRIARELVVRALESGDGVTGYQVIQEFINTVRKKFSRAVSIQDLREYVLQTMRPMLGVHPAMELFEHALSLHERHKISWYDCLIIAAAVESRCAVLYTEDLQHGRKIEGLKILNPFLSN